MSLLKFIFNTTYSKEPMFLHYNVGNHKVTGEDYYKVLDIIKPGDILLRGYDNCLSKFIIPGKYSHSGLYYKHPEILHATVENGVCKTNLVDFMRCDRLMILRPKDPVLCSTAISFALEKLGKSYDNEFEDNDDEYYCHELIANCYKYSNIDKYYASTLFGLVKKYIYCADSFIKNKNFEKVIEIDHSIEEKKND